MEVAGSSSVADPVVNALTTGSVLDVGVINTSEVTIVTEARAVRRAPAHRGQGAGPEDEGLDALVGVRRLGPLSSGAAPADPATKTATDR